MSKKAKYYVVWNGKEPGVYTTWEECQKQVVGIPEALYKSFPSKAEAQKAFAGCPSDYFQASHPTSKASSAPASSVSAPSASRLAASSTMPTPSPSCDGVQNPPDWRHDTVLPLPPEVTAQAWAVDAACSGNPGPMEYRGVDLATGAVVFHYGPVHGTNNIGEFLAIVHALALLKQQGKVLTIYTDSRNALLWLKKKTCRTTLQRTVRTEKLFDLIARAETWLRTHDYSDIPIRKWETARWGEVPADFGRK